MVSAGALALIGASMSVSPGGAKSPALPEPPESGEMGFVIDQFSYAMYQGKDDCPGGAGGLVRDNFLATLPAAERVRLLRKENEEELTRRWKGWVFGPDRTNICSDPWLFQPRPPHPVVHGKISIGLNLDNDSSGQPADGCAHENFTSPSSERGIDNQLYRSMGCVSAWRGVEGADSENASGFVNFLASGEWTIVLLLRGVDSLQNDDDVEVIIANTKDRPILDSQRRFVSGASFNIVDNSSWRNVLKGRIRAGVLTTEPDDIRLTQVFGLGGRRGELAEFDIRGGRLELRFAPDRTVGGLLGGYQFPEKIIQIPIMGGAGSATVAGIDCATQLATMLAHADGVRDPATGKCTAVSSAMKISGVPAFVHDRKPASDAGTGPA